MCLMVSINGNLFNIGDNGAVVTVPVGAGSNVLALFQANDNPIGDNQGQVTFDLSVCNPNYSSAVACNTPADFTYGTHGWKIGDPAGRIGGTTPGVWTVGAGFRSGTSGSPANVLELAITNDGALPASTLTAIEVTVKNNSAYAFGQSMNWRYKKAGVWQTGTPASLNQFSGSTTPGGTEVWRTAPFIGGVGLTGVTDIEIYYSEFKGDGVPHYGDLWITEVKLTC